jgi:release factor glutamine methyltransferase
LATVGDLLDAAQRRLAGRGSASPGLDAQVLLAHVLGIGRAALFARRGDPVDDADAAAFESLIARREALVPVAYLTGSKEFWSLDLEVDEHVLVPRPETEGLVEEALKLLRREGGRRPPHIADAGTGAGPIAIALAREIPEARLDATDLSAEAIEIAERNARRHGVADRIRFHVGDLLEPVLESRGAGVLDLVASNPPYIADGEEVDEGVRRWEPALALYAPGAGMEVIERLVSQSERALAPGGWLVLEIGPARESGVRDLLQASGLWRDLMVRADLGGLPRIVSARFEPAERGRRAA